MRADRQARKRNLFQKAALAALAVAAYLHPKQRQFLQHSTTSPTMHKLLDVDGKSA